MENLIAQVGMDLDSWDSGMDQLLADERKVEKALEGVVDSANDAEKALNGIDGAIDLDVDTGDLEKAKRIVEDLDSMDGAIDLSVDESELDAVRRLLADIDSDTPTVNVVVDESEIDAAKDEVADIDNATPTVDVDVDKEEVDATQTLLQEIRDMQAIDLAINITGNIESVFETLSNLPGIGTIVEMDNAMAGFEGRTGRAGIQLENLVDQLHGQGIVASREQIGEIATLSSQLQIAWGDTDEAVAATLNTISVTGGDANETLTTMTNLVNLGLFENFTQASDAIVAGFQNGADRGGDLLDVLNEYGSTFAALGIDGPAAISLINSGLEAGFGNADRVADTLREMGIRVHELDPVQIDAAMTAFANGEISVDELNTALGETGTALNELDLLDETEAFLSGDLSGEDFFNSVIEGLQGVESESDRARLAVQIFGTQAEDIGVGAITALTTEGFNNIEGAAQDAANSMTDTIGGSVAELMQLVDDLAAAFFNSDSLDIQGKLDDAKARIQTFIDEINSGATFGEALEIALDAPGLEDRIEDLQATLGNFLLGFMDVLADILSIIPGQEDAVAAIRAGVTDMAEGQLTFDIMVADDAQGVTEAVQTAIDRGVDSQTIADSLQAAFDEALASGDIEGAAEIAFNIEQSTQQTVQMAIDSEGAFQEFEDVPSVTASLELDTEAMYVQLDAAAADIRDQIDAALAAGDVSGASALAETIGSNLSDQFARLVSEGSFDLAAIIAAGAPEEGLDITSAAEAAGYSDEDIATLESNAQAAVDTTAQSVAELTATAETASADTTAALEDTSAAYSTFSTDTSTAMQTAGDAATDYSNTVATAMQNVQTSIDGATEHVQTLIAAFHDAQAEANATVTTTTDVNGSAPGHYLGGVDDGTFMTGERGRELVTTDTAVAILNNETTESILSGLAAILSGGYTGGGGSSITINQSNVFNNNGGAASVASLNNASNAIRGY